MDCAACGASMRPGARFCPQCGAESKASVERSRVEVKRAAALDRRRGWALALGFVGALGSLGLGAWADGRGDSPTFVLALGVFADLAVGIGVLAMLGGGAWQRHLAGRPGGKHLLMALPVGLACFLVALGASELILRAIPDELVAGQEIDLTWILGVLLVAPLLEEWLCRGVFWEACRGVGGEGSTVVATAILFAMLHGWNGGFVLELPHRFVGGLLLGGLRSKSGSLVPSVLAHFVWNGLALASMG